MELEAFTLPLKTSCATETVVATLPAADPIV